LLLSHSPNNDNHMDLIRVFDQMPFMSSGKRLMVKPNGFTDLQHNEDLRNVRFKEQLFGVNEFNNEHYFFRDLNNNNRFNSNNNNNNNNNHRNVNRNDENRHQAGMRQRRLSTTGDLRERIEKDWDATPPQTNSNIPVIAHQQNLVVESQKRMRESESNESLASSMAAEKKKTKVVNLMTIAQQEQHCLPATVSLGRFERYESSKSGISSEDEDDDDEWVDVKKR
jgi:hypothetical protein